VLFVDFKTSLANDFGDALVGNSWSLILQNVQDVAVDINIIVVNGWKKELD